MDSDGVPPVATGLREVKKRQARARIRREALRLFVAQGFAQTTTEQIAAAAEVSPRTLFRYFPTKQSIVVSDDDGDALADAVAVAPAGLSRVEAIVAGCRTAFGESGEDDPAEIADAEEEVVARTPELGAVALAQVRRSMNTLAAVLDDRFPEQTETNLPVAGSVIGLALAVDQRTPAGGAGFAATIEDAVRAVLRDGAEH